MLTNDEPHGVTYLLAISTFYHDSAACLRRLFTGDTFGLRPNPKAEVCWMPVKEDCPGNRPDKSY